MAHPEEAHHEQVPDHSGPRRRLGWWQPGRGLGRRRSVRTRITTLLVVPLMLFTLVWAWGLYLTAENTLEINLLARTEAALHQQTAKLFDAVHEERRATSAYLGGKKNPRYRTDLVAARRATDRAATGLDTLVTDDVLEAVNPQERDWLLETQERIGGLKGLRERVDNGEAGRPTAEERYTDLVRACLGVFEQMSADINPAYGSYHQTMVDLQKAREALSLEDSLVAGALASGRITTAEYTTFVRRVGAARALFAEAEANIVDEKIRSHASRTLSSDAFAQLRELEDTLAAEQRVDNTLPFTVTQWNSAAGQVIGDLLHLDHMVHTALVDNATPVVISIVTNIAGMIVLGLIVIGIAVYLRRRTLRPLTRDLVNLKDAALQLAHERLPRVVAKLQRGEHVDVAVEAPPLRFGDAELSNDELGDVGRAFNVVQKTAVQTAYEQASLRSGIRDTFVNLARRSQGLVHRQLALLDEMERRTSDPDELEQLFAIDHLATRMRRHAEDLIILSGSAPGRQWRKPVPMVDVVRSAVGEIESYSRVTVLPMADGWLSGRVVADVIHLLAELVENAATYSPPQTKVRVGGDLVPNGFVVEIEDSGLGMSREDLTRYNERLVSPPEFNPADSIQLGLFVVARLAQRHGIRVHLRDSPYGGTTAIVLIPGSLVEGAADVKQAIEAGPSASTTRADRPSPNRSTTPPPVAAVEAAPVARPPAHLAPETPVIDPVVPERPTPDISGFDTLALETLSMEPPASTAPTNGGPLEARQVSPGGAYATAEFDLGSERLDLGSATRMPTTARTAPEPAPDSVGDPGGTEADNFEHRHGSLPESKRPFDPNAAPATSTGLPRRVRQASLASELREDTKTSPAPARQPAENPPAGRSPEKIRQMMTTFQRGSQRGRNEAPRADSGPPAANSRPSPRSSATSQNEDK